MNVIRIRPIGLSVVRLTVICVTCIAALAVLGLSGDATAQEFLLVTPPSLEDAEGDTAIFTLTGPPPPNGFRAQWTHLASDFSGLPDGHNTIVSMAWRPDFTVTNLNRTHDFELRLSTTSAAPGTLSNTFAMNTGSDEITVYSGLLTMTTDGAGGPAGGPRPFDYLIPFHEPFVYDPDQGNLLVDFSFFPFDGGGSLFADAQETTLVQSVGATNASALTGPLPDSRVVVTQFAFVPEPSTFFLAALGLIGLLACCRKKGQLSQV